MKENKKKLVVSLVHDALKLISGDNKIEINNYFAFDEIQELIAIEMDSNNDIPLSFRSFAVRKSLSTLKSSTQDPSHFFELYAKERIKFLKKPTSKYYLLGTISSDRNFSQQFALFSKTERIRISIAKSFPKKLRGFSDFTNNLYGIDSSLPENFSRIVVSCYARSAESAGSNALNHIDILLSCLNLYQNGRTRPLGESFLRLPINRFMLGPQQTLHFASGHRVESIHFEEPDKEKCLHSPFRPNLDEEYISFVKLIYRCIRRSAVRHRIENALRAYLRATESRSTGELLIYLWACLEILFSMEKNSIDHKRLLIRIKNIYYNDSQRIERVLAFAFHNRNIVAHQSTQPMQYTTLLHSFRQIVERLILFTARESVFFASEADWQDFLDLPRSRTELSRRKNILIKLLNKLDVPK